MDIRISRLIPEHAEDYVTFFDQTDHDDNVYEHKCYCICWSSDNCDNKDFSTIEKRRKYARQYVENQNLNGYLAYYDDKVVGWCNANTKSDCLNCESWREYLDFVPLQEPKSGVKVKSIFCFVIAPEMKRKGIATQLLNRVCDDAVKDGFDFVEAYPYKNANPQSTEFGGYQQMYQKCGFSIVFESEDRLVMRKKLK